MNERMTWAKAKVWMRTHPGEKLTDSQGDDWVWHYGAEDPVFLGRISRKWVPWPHEDSEGPSATFMRLEPRVTRIDVRQRADGMWEWQFKASDGTVRWNSGAPSRPNVVDIARALPDFDFSDAFTIVAPYEAPKPAPAKPLEFHQRYIEGYLKRAIEEGSRRLAPRKPDLIVYDEVQDFPPCPAKSRVTRIDVKRNHLGDWHCAFTPRGGIPRVCIFDGRKRPSVRTIDSMFREFNERFDFSDAFLIIEDT